MSWQVTLSCIILLQFSSHERSNDFVEEHHPHSDHHPPLLHNFDKSQPSAVQLTNFQCRRQIHPFQDARYEDFATIFSKLFNLGVTSAHDTAYTDTFYQLAQDLAEDAAQILVQGDNNRGGPHHHLAAQQLLRACALLRVARFPYATGDDSGVRNSTSDRAEDDDAYASSLALKKPAYALQQTLYLRAMRFWDVDGLAPLEEVRVPHVHDLATHPDSGRNFDMGLRPSPLGSGGIKGQQGARRPHIPMYVRVPLDTLLTGQQCPVMLILSADRTGETRRCEEALARGWAAVVVEVPGMGASPVRRGDGHDAEARLWSSVLDWMRGMYFYDMDRVVVASSGAEAGPTAARLAQSHGSRLKGVVMHADAAAQTEIASVQCPLLVAATHNHDESSLAVSAQKQRSPSTPNGLWTPVPEDAAVLVEEDDDDENLMKLSEYRRDAKGCVAQMRTSDVGKVYGWMEDVMESRETQIRESPLLCRDSSLWAGCHPAGSRMLWWVDQWNPPSPPNSEGQGEKNLWMARSSAFA